MQPVNNAQVYVSGDVVIDPSAAIASGVILQATGDSKIVIGAGVSLGMGVILHASQGAIEIESGATLAAGTLIVGKGKIGANACIGAASTIFYTSIEPLQIVPAGSVIGDPSRQVTVSQTSVEFEVKEATVAASAIAPARKRARNYPKHPLKNLQKIQILLHLPQSVILFMGKSTSTRCYLLFSLTISH